MRTKETQVFKYEELDDSAKERARDWYRGEGDGLDHDWWECSYEWINTAAELIGIDINSRPAKNMKGEPIKGQLRIFFSGFSSQGDGACFEGRYEYRKGSSKAVRKEFPMDTGLHRIADDLARLQKAHFYRLTARVEHRGHYSHPGCTVIDTDGFNEDASDEDLRDYLRDFMHWMYQHLEKEYEYLTSDEAVEENIIANDYEFDSQGRREW